MATTYTCWIIDAMFAKSGVIEADRAAFDKSLGYRFLEGGEFGTWSFSSTGEDGSTTDTTVIGYYALMGLGRMNTAIESFWTIETVTAGVGCCNCGCSSCDSCCCCCAICKTCDECACCCSCS